MLTGRLRSRRRQLGEERGAVLAFTAIILTVVLLVAAYVIDEGIWFVHRQHLQTQADAAALGAAHEFQYPCTPGGTMDQAIAGEVHRFDGTATGAYNPQVWATPTSGTNNPPTSAYSNSAHNLFSVMNRPNFFNQSEPSDSDLSGTSSADGSPCSDAAIDVKLSETNLQSVFPFGNPAYINAQARVSIEKLTTSAGSEPFVEPAPSAPPSSITATLVDESNGNSLVAGPVSLNPAVGNPSTFTGQLPSVTFPSLTPGATGASHAIGLQLCYQGGSCYESGGGSQGVTFTRDWATSTSPTAPPQVNDITVLPDPNGNPACSNPGGTANGTNFTSTSGNCTVVVKASSVTVPTVSGAACNNLSLTLTAGTGSPQAVPCPVSGNNPVNGQTWVSSPVTVAENAGQMQLTLGWKLTSGTIPSGASGGSGGSCTNSNPCTGTLGVQRVNSGAFSSTDASSSNSGSITGVALTDPSGNQIMSVQGGTTESVNIAVSVLSFQPATSFTAPLLKLSLAGNQGNAAISCNGNGNGSPAFFQSIVSGCSATYQTQPAPGSCPSPAAYSTPPSCAQENPGNGKLANDLADAMNCRINGSGQVGSGGKCNPQPSGCVNPNHWTAGPDPLHAQTISQVLSAAPSDPRLIMLPITNNGALINGSASVPVIAFATFYVTGWSGGDPCIGQAAGQSSNGVYYTGDDNPGANAPAGTLVGHFVQYTVPSAPGEQGNGTCTPGTLGDCIPVLTK